MKIKNSQLDKPLFYAAIIIVSLIVSFTFGLYSGAVKNRLFDFVVGIRSDVKEVVSETTNLVKPIHFLQPARYRGDGVTINLEATNDRDFIFLSGFFEGSNELRLIQRNGDIVARWKVSFSEIFTDTSHLDNPPATDWNIDIHGALALPDGSVVFNFEYGGLVKLDRCGEILWKLQKPSHHSVELAEQGGFWVPGRNYYQSGQASPFPPYTPPYGEDTIMKVSDEGKVVFELSVPGLFYANDLEPLFTSTGESIHPRTKWDNELVHLNKITELRSDIAEDFPLFEAGDLLISLRKFNMLLVIDPETRKIKWHKIGPWKRQHDPEFIAGGKIIIFNNNIYRSAFGHRSGITELNVPRISNIMQYDFITGDHSILYGGHSDQELLSVIRGKQEFTQDNGLLITEFEAGRVLEVNKSGQVIWEYINRYDNNLVAEISEARIYPEAYFNVQDWSCPTNTAN